MAFNSATRRAMTAGTQVNIPGAKEMETLLRKLPTKIGERVLTASLRKGAKIIKADAERRVPVKTGAHRADIVVRKVSFRKLNRLRGNTRAASVVIAFKKRSSRTAHLIEFGTSHSAAQPFMRPAVAAKGREAIGAIGKELGKRIEREAVKLASGLQLLGPKRKGRRRRR